LQIATKPLQIATWLPLTAYRNLGLPTPYQTLPSSPTPYDVPFSHNIRTYVTDDRQRTDERLVVS